MTATGSLHSLFLLFLRPHFLSVTVNLKTWIWWWYLVTTAMLNSLLWYFLPGWDVSFYADQPGEVSTLLSSTSVPNLFANCSDRETAERVIHMWGLWSEKVEDREEKQYKRRLRISLDISGFLHFFLFVSSFHVWPLNVTLACIAFSIHSFSVRMI